MPILARNITVTNRTPNTVCILPPPIPVNVNLSGG
jgi:hypothetical protein